MNRMQRQKGFTLIEILIVIVILAVLAAMVLPRMLIQTENGYISEAQNIMGALRSAEITATDSGAQAAWSAQADTTIAIPALNWKAGNDSNNWTIVATAANTITATRKNSGGGTYDGQVITLSEAGAWTCPAKYAAVANNGGCRVAS